MKPTKNHIQHELRQVENDLTERTWDDVCTMIQKLAAQGIRTLDMEGATMAVAALLWSQGFTVIDASAAAERLMMAVIE